MAAVTEIRRALAARLVVLELAVQVAPAQVDYKPLELAQQFAVRVMAGSLGDERAEELLDELIEPEGERSVKQLLEADSTIDGLVIDATVTRCTGWQTFPHPDGTAAIGATWTVNTIT